MTILNFKEIPEAHKGGGQQDKFELLSRDLFIALGYRIDSAPGRGADGGKDLILTEVRTGIAGNTEIKWLVSCKHKAHSGASVGKGDEPEISDSLKANKCTGFIGFYSTLPSSGLITKVEGMDDIEHQFFDSSKIEQILLTEPKCLNIAQRYFPQSYKGWSDENPSVAQIFSDQEPFKCEHCGDQLDREHRGLVVSWRKVEEQAGKYVNQIRNQYVCCAGECDRELKEIHSIDGYVSSWAELRDYFTPTLYLKAVMVFCNALNEETSIYSPDAFEQQKEILINCFPYVCRNLTKQELEQVDIQNMLPKILGGFA